MPDSKEVKRIAQQLSMTYNSIQGLLEENKIEFKSGKSILEAIFNLEREILPGLHYDCWNLPNALLGVKIVKS